MKDATRLVSNQVVTLVFVSQSRVRYQNSCEQLGKGFVDDVGPTPELWFYAKSFTTRSYLVSCFRKTQVPTCIVKAICLDSGKQAHQLSMQAT